MSNNLDQSPVQSSTSSLASASRNLAGRIGFSLSLIGVIGLCLVGPFGPLIGTIGIYITFLCLPGLVTSVVGMFRTPQRLARWGVALGVFGSMYLPTFYLTLSAFGRR